MTTPDPQPLLEASIGVTGKNLLGAAVGAFISMNFMDDLSLKHRWTTAISGWLLGAYGGAPLAEWLGIVSAQITMGLCLGVALFGMAVTSAIIKLIRETAWSDLLRQVLKQMNPFSKKG